MLKKTIKYTDFNDVEHEEDFYFNLSKAELTEMEMSEDGGMANKLQRIVEANNGRQIIQAFKDILFKAYGQKSEDGKRFIKSEEISKEFEQTGAYDVLFNDLLSDPEYASEFINGLIPSHLAKQLNDGPKAPKDFQKKKANN